MDYLKKAPKWKSDPEANADIERILASDGKMAHENKNGIDWIDSIYYCMRRDGKKVLEALWKNGDDEETVPLGRFMVKGRKKMIFAQGEVAYGFGFGDKERKESMVLYFRKRGGAMLIWSDASSKFLNVMYEVNTNHPDSMDSLIKFMQQEKDEGTQLNEERIGGI